MKTLRNGEAWHSWGPKAFTGYQEYRHGVPVKSSRREPVFNKDATNALVMKIASYLRQFHLTPFEFEGACRHNLRSALCLVGYRWGVADAEAARIVAQALGRLNARRPTWEEGQREHVVPIENCYRCQGPLDDMQMARSQRFCSDECAKAHVEARNYVGHIYENKVATSAYRAVLQSKRALVTCKHCDKQFRPNTPGGTWEYCSHSCSSKAKMKLAVACAAPRECPVCHSTYQPRAPQQAFCTDKCRSRVSDITAKLRAGKNVRLNQLAFDYFVVLDLERRALTPATLDALLEAA